MKWKDYSELGMRLDEALQARAIVATSESRETAIERLDQRCRLLHDTRRAAGSAAAAHTQDEE